MIGMGVNMLVQDFLTRRFFSNRYYEYSPDVAVMGPDGKPEKIYDFKGRTDRWRNGQKELEGSKNSGAFGVVM